MLLESLAQKNNLTSLQEYGFVLKPQRQRDHAGRIAASMLLFLAG